MKKVAVLGAGVMGSTIAAHLVNAGLDVVLLDLEIEDGGKKVDLAAVAVAKMKKANPSPIYLRPWLAKIKTGTFQNNMDLIADCDWVIEVVKEDIAVKKKLFDSVLPHLSSKAYFTSNTSGIPISELSALLPEEVRPRFLGTHFFNPPRYMKLLEIIPGPETQPETLKYFGEFGEKVLGKGVVYAKDRPNFIANRIGVQAMMATIMVMKRDGYTIEEVDKIMGSLAGRPKSAIFRTADLVGLDTFTHVCDNLYEAVPEDECRDYFKIPEEVRGMIEKGYLGNKTRGGFYKRVKGEGGKKEIQVINLETLEYEPKKKVKLPSIELVKNIEDTKERLAKVVRLPDRVGSYVWNCMSEMMVYAVARLNEVSDDIVNIDRAMRWGFNWELGPFETWDTLGIEYVVKRLKKEGRKVPALIEQMLADGVTSFYKEETEQPQYYVPSAKSFENVPARPNVLILKDHKRGENRVVKRTPGASLVDLGDGVACLEFHSKMNSIGSDTINMTFYAVDQVEKNFEALVLGNQGEHFSAGANLMLILMEAQEQNFEDINYMIRQFQRATTSLRYCKKPVVVAPHGLTLGGGCEFTIHGDGVQAAAETYMGLVEVGVGMIPAGGGTKEMLLRTVGAAKKRGDKDLFPAVQKAFELIGMAKVATSGEEARQFGFLTDYDGVSINGDSVIYDAKQRALGLAKIGYKVPAVPKDIPVLGAPAYGALKMGLMMMRDGGYISDHDLLIGTKLAKILTGGDLTPGSTMTEEQVLDLEREAFLSLCGERKSLERIHHMLTRGKPLRN
ncbi:MAG: 3-hydroxyacyl-CoA dehydrogenase [Acidobacteria bacterium]|nr:MAG: 3-hydroxyacyl-CoA dehydrogenase [Acidobacteriota bacterium]PIE90793.1 MAG: 3-hydroxyacyl-CoA dehydrogenase [Acidobacteriota bacterium]